MDFLDQQKISADITNEKDKKKAIQIIKRAEMKNQCFKTMKNIKNPQQSGSISHLLIPDGDNIL